TRRKCNPRLGMRVMTFGFQLFDEDWGLGSELPGQTENGELSEPEALLLQDLDASVAARHELEVLDAANVVPAIEVGDLEEQGELPASDRNVAACLHIQPVIRGKAGGVSRPQDRLDRRATVGGDGALGFHGGGGPSRVGHTGEVEGPGVPLPIAQAEVEGVPLVPAPRDPAAVDLVLGVSERVSRRPGEGASAVGGKGELHSPGGGAPGG